MKQYKYSKQVHLGYDANGKQIRKRFYADTKADLNKQIRHYKDKLEKITNPSDVTFGEYSAAWLETKKPTIKIRTFQFYELSVNHCAELNEYNINKITKTLCQKIVNKYWNKPHAAKSVADMLKKIFSSAVDDGIIYVNPAAKLDRPKLNKPKWHLLTDQELEAVDKADLNENDRLFVTILRVFGLRPGEALALSPRDFDFKQKVLHITKALELPKSGPSRIKETKTEMNRDIPIPDYLISSLSEQIQGKPAFYLFLNANGCLHTTTSYKRLSKRIWKAVNVALGGDEYHDLTKGLRLYDFRHRRATDLYYLCQHGLISTKKAAELMGHSEVMFLQRYSHLDEAQEQAADIYANQKPVNL